MRASRRFVVAALVAAAPAGIARADFQADHPAYLHALSDLRAARWLIAHRPGDPDMVAHEQAAIQRIDAAIRELVAASIDDGKDIYYQPRVDLPNDRRPGRLRKAIELLSRARHDISQEEDNPMVLGMRHRAVENIEHAIRQTGAALQDAERYQ